MNNEPLTKDKVELKNGYSLNTDVIRKDDVLSALEGLKEDTRDLYRVFDKGKVWSWNNDELADNLSDYVQQRIDKWFPFAKDSSYQLRKTGNDVVEKPLESSASDGEVGHMSEPQPKRSNIDKALGGSELDEQFYACGHKPEPVICNSDILTIAAYLEWKDSTGWNGDNTECWACFCKRFNSLSQPSNEEANAKADGGSCKQEGYSKPIEQRGVEAGELSGSPCKESDVKHTPRKGHGNWEDDL